MRINVASRWQAERMSPTAIDLFCGAGGASLGLSRAGWDLRLATDVDLACCTTHRANLDCEFLAADLRSIDADKVMAAAGISPGQLDLLFAGPLCQGFSIIASRVVWDERNNLFKEVLRLARETATSLCRHRERAWPSHAGARCLPARHTGGPQRGRIRSGVRGAPRCPIWSATNALAVDHYWLVPGSSNPGWIRVPMPPGRQCCYRRPVAELHHSAMATGRLRNCCRGDR